jgi:outer membrane protein
MYTSVESLRKYLLILLVVALAGAAVPVSAQEKLPVYDLSQCIAIALDESPSLAISLENSDIAGHEVRKAWGSFLPSLSASRSSSTSDRTDFDYQVDPTIPAADLEQQFKSYDYGLSSNWNIFGGFRKIGALKSARNGLNAARADQSYSRQLVIETVAQAYINLLRNERLLEVAKDAKDLAARELEKSETYHRIGSAARSDVLQAKVRLGQTRLDEIRAQNSVEQSFAELSHAMNRPLATRFRVDSSLLDADYELNDLQALFEEALVARPDLQSIMYQVDARKGDVTSAGSNLLPSLDLFWRYAHNTNESEFRFGAQESQSISYGYSINWNVFDRFQTLSGRTQAKARVRIAEYNLDQKQLDIQLEVRQLYNSVREAQERISLSRETIANADEELRLAQERFKVGAGTTLDTITAQVNLAQARGDEVQALSDYLIASLQLDRAVGRPLDRLMQ